MNKVEMFLQPDYQPTKVVYSLNVDDYPTDMESRILQIADMVLANLSEPIKLKLKNFRESGTLAAGIIAKVSPVLVDGQSLVYERGHLILRT